MTAFIGYPEQHQLADFLAEYGTNGELSYGQQLMSTLYETKAEFEKQEDFKQYNVDVHRICLGRGQKYYDAGVRAMHKWITLKLGWVEVFPSIPEMVVGSRFLCLTRGLGLWVVNALKVLHVIDNEMSRDQTKKRSGLVYGTLTQNIVKGEQRFWVEMDLTDDTVYFEILSISKTNSLMTQITYPYSRSLQDQFLAASCQSVLKFCQEATSVVNV